MERKRKEAEDKELDLELDRKREELLLQAKRKELERQRKESDLRKKKSQLLGSSAASSVVADVERELGACKKKVLSHRPKTSNEAAEAFQRESETNPNPKSSVQEELQLKMMTNLENMVLENSMPKLHVPKFDGSPSKYTAFINSFDSIIVSKTNDPVRLLQYLIDCCEKDALEKIQAWSILPPAEGYKRARETLKLHYGQPYMVARCLLEELLALEPLEKDKSKGLGKKLLTFHSKLATAHATMQSIRAEGDINSQITIKTLLAKLPSFACNEFKKDAARIYSDGREPNIKDLMDFVLKVAHRENHAYADVNSMKQKAPEKKADKDVRTKPSRQTSTGKVSTYTTDQEKIASTPQTSKQPTKFACLHCSEPHTLERCQKFKGLNMQERMKQGRKLEICFNCLRKGHASTACKFDSNCLTAGCDKKHHGLFHFFKREETDKSSKQAQSGSTIRDDLSSKKSNPVAKQKSTGAGNETGAGAQESYHVNMTTNRISLGILPVVVKAKGSDTGVKVYALLDDGSTGVVFNESLLGKLGVGGTQSVLETTTIIGKSKEACRAQEFVVEAIDGSNFVECLGFSRKDMNVGRRNIPTHDEIQKYSHLKDIEFLELQDKNVYILIGTNVPEAHWVLESRRGKRKEPYATRGLLGWTVRGPLSQTSKENECFVNFVDNTISNEDLHEQVERLFRQDFTDHHLRKPAWSVEDKLAMQIINDSTSLKDDGHYEVAIPFKPLGQGVLDMHCQDSYHGSFKRLMWLRKRFLKNPNLFEKYTAKLDKLQSSGYTRIVAPENIDHSSGWYLPHHPAFHPQKPEDVRVVNDGAAKFGGTSLNDQLMQGPDINNNLVGVLLRFRNGHFAVTGDVEGMFHQVAVPSHQVKYYRFLWFKDNDLHGPVEEREHTVHLFGSRPSPTIANNTLSKTAEDNANDFSAEVVAVVKENFYVDDMALSKDTEEQCVEIVTELPRLFDRGGFNLTKIATNSPLALLAVDESKKASSMKEIDFFKLETVNQPTERTLGIHWDVVSDEFKCRVIDPSDKATKRNVLSVLSRVFDPLGLASPFMLEARRIYQNLCRENYGWDGEFYEEHLKLWLAWLLVLQELVHFKVSRCYKPIGFGVVVDIQLHLFSDAAQKIGYGAVAYLRYENDGGQVHCSIVMGKSRVVPSKPISTVPRLELIAAAVSAKMGSQITGEIRLDLSDILYWTDSTTVIQYLRNPTVRYPTFEANKVQLIQELSPVSKWHHVPTDLNPADIASRSMKMSEPEKVNTWKHGPKYLWKRKEEWPKEPEGLGQLPAGMFELSSQITSSFAQDLERQASVEIIDLILSKISSWRKMTKIVAWWLRLQSRHHQSNGETTRQISTSPESQRVRSSRPLSVEDIKKAEIAIVGVVQQRIYPHEYQILLDTCFKTPNVPEKLAKSSSLWRLHPIMASVDKLMRINSRLNNALLSDEFKSPAILPAHCHVSKLIVIHYHEQSHHMGPSYVLSKIRQKYWIVKGHAFVRSVLKNCFACKLRNKAPEGQVMAPLPDFKQSSGGYAFETVGVDYFGPFYVKHGRKREKRWCCLFTCLTIRAVHLEVAFSCESDSFLCAFFRFVARRGVPKDVYSDQGKNFVGAVNDFQHALERWDQTKIHGQLLNVGSNWHFGPPEAHHWGGSWERMIRSVRQVLFHVMSEQSLTEETLLTFVAEAEKVLNDRPIIKASSDVDAFAALTPNDLILRRQSPSLPPGDFDPHDMYKARWRQAHYLADVFWKRFTAEYLPLLQLRSKWHKPQRNLQVGDLVLLVNEHVKRRVWGQWSKALVEETFPGTDGVVREVRIRTSTSSYVRDVRSLCLLEAAT